MRRRKYQPRQRSIAAHPNGGHTAWNLDHYANAYGYHRVREAVAAAGSHPTNADGELNNGGVRRLAGSDHFTSGRSVTGLPLAPGSFAIAPPCASPSSSASIPL